MWDVLVAGAGPAGTVAATILARAGARVLMVDRQRFPRSKLCGDSVNPGTVAALRRLGMASGLQSHAFPIEGITLTGPGGARVEGRYPRSLHGCSISRRELDKWLLDDALAAGAHFEEGVVVREPLIGNIDRAGNVGVTGAIVGTGGDRRSALPARVTIAADGRRSTFALRLGLLTHPAKPRRWGIGAYFEDTSGGAPVVEMHVSPGEYIGVAPLGGGLSNLCLATTRERLSCATPEQALRRVIERDARLRDRFAGARIASGPLTLGPLAVDVPVAGAPGLLLAGDAAGFVDPITGDGMGFAVRGAELAAAAALDMLATGASDGHLMLARRRADAFRWKWRFNRTLRHVVGSPTAVSGAVLLGSIAPAMIRSLITIAGDCHTDSA